MPSAMGAATIAPIKVPIDSIATIVPDRTLLKEGPGLSPKAWRKFGISRKPDICPVGYVRT
jgi:hypothetical protein